MDDNGVLAVVENKPQPQHFGFVAQFREEDLELEVVQVGFDVGHQQHDVLRSKREITAWFVSGSLSNFSILEVSISSCWILEMLIVVGLSSRCSSWVRVAGYLVAVGCAA